MGHFTKVTTGKFPLYCDFFFLSFFGCNNSFVCVCLRVRLFIDVVFIHLSQSVPQWIPVNIKQQTKSENSKSIKKKRGEEWEKAGKVIMQQGNKLCRRKKKNLSRHFHWLDKRCHWQKHFLLFDCDNALALMCRLETISCSNETRIYPMAVFFFYLSHSHWMSAAGAAVT